MANSRRTVYAVQGPFCQTTPRAQLSTSVSARMPEITRNGSCSTFRTIDRRPPMRKILAALLACVASGCAAQHPAPPRTDLLACWAGALGGRDRLAALHTV